jgi:hypothetical protein
MSTSDFTPEALARMSAAGKNGALAVWSNPERRAKAVAAKEGTPLSAKHRANIAVGKEGQRLSFEHRRNISAGVKAAAAARKAAAQ